jgi:acyl-coenzyme A thioesterase PaaI-like protein
VDDRDPGAELADELRQLIETLQVTDVPESDLEALVDDVRNARDRLSAYARRTSWYEADALDAEGAFDLIASRDGSRTVTHIHRSPITGRYNGAAPPLAIEMIDDDERPRSVGTVTFTATHEGAPGIVHGGWIAAVLDEALAWAQPLSGVAGFTGTITVRFRAPAPTYTPLHLTGWVDRIDGRKVYVVGTCEAGGTLVAEAEAVFISPASLAARRS